MHANHWVHVPSSSVIDPLKAYDATRSKKWQGICTMSDYKTVIILHSLHAGCLWDALGWSAHLSHLWLAMFYYCTFAHRGVVPCTLADISCTWNEHTEQGAVVFSRVLLTICQPLPEISETWPFLTHGNLHVGPGCWINHFNGTFLLAWPSKTCMVRKKWACCCGVMLCKSWNNTSWSMVNHASPRRMYLAVQEHTTVIDQSIGVVHAV